MDRRGSPPPLQDRRFKMGPWPTGRRLERIAAAAAAATGAASRSSHSRTFAHGISDGTQDQGGSPPPLQDRRFKIGPWPTGRRLKRIAAAITAAATTGAASRSSHSRTFAHGISDGTQDQGGSPPPLQDRRFKIGPWPTGRRLKRIAAAITAAATTGAASRSSHSRTFAHGISDGTQDQGGSPPPLQDRRFKIGPWPTGRRGSPPPPQEPLQDRRTQGPSPMESQCLTILFFIWDPGPRRIAAATTRSPLQDRTLTHGSKTEEDRRRHHRSRFKIVALKDLRPWNLRWDPGPRRIAAATTRSPLQDRTLTHGSKTEEDRRRRLHRSRFKIVALKDLRPWNLRWDPGPRRIAAATTRSSPPQQRTPKIFKWYVLI
ncbi:LOW QUALITY PROTEIN: hypothetical protein DAPPUDRAFT_237369 [Daphnia pulex]|uniref:Uncharacterized protein n=1 Tax=Daphnia pulex TaxID=6669 RepID=E9G3R4_DAPPU|nr:LOW QUALITY PROTEIN: hypothetical protein DAPPUDRAFT_237369 [Daphnia pulex]|eukprot:EFX85934.1 LOW QUALITY PROTEIN: hypothetical protein DAPPUDRAFT_237369 [Daphnia pulex]